MRIVLDAPRFRHGQLGWDPWVAYLPDGTPVVSFLADTEKEESALLLFRSTDRGRTWPRQPLSLGGGHDHPTLVVDRSSKQFDGRKRRRRETR